MSAHRQPTRAQGDNLLTFRRENRVFKDVGDEGEVW